jgi:hypothetical protein
MSLICFPFTGSPLQESQVMKAGTKNCKNIRNSYFAGFWAISSRRLDYDIIIKIKGPLG